MDINRYGTLKENLLNQSSETNDSTQSDLSESDQGAISTVWLVTKKALPLVIAGFGNAVKPTVTFYFINNFAPDNTVFAAIGLGIMLMNIFLRSYITGFNNFMITQISQAFGANRHEEVGDILNRNKVICTCLMFPLMVPLFFVGDLLVMIGQPVELSYTTQYFVRIAMPGFISQLHYDIYRKYLNSIGLFTSNMPIPLITLVFHYFFCWLFIAYYRLELVGAAMVTLLQPVNNHLIIYLIVCYGEGGKYLRSITSNAFHGWVEIIREGIPSYFLQFVTTISLETLILFTGFISIKLVVANTAYINIFFLLYISVVGVQQSSGPMIGNKIGEGDYAGALRIIKANVVFGLGFGFVVVALILNFQDVVIRFYIKDEKIILLMKEMLPYFCSTLYLTVYKDILIGILIGLGLQNQTLKYTIISFIFIYMPCLTMLTFHLGLPGTGPWISLTVVLASSVLYYHYLIRRYDVINKLEDASAAAEQEKKSEVRC